MAFSQSLIGLVGVSLLLARLAYALAPGRRRVHIAVLVFAAAFLPLSGLPLAGYVRGITGDLSVTTLVCLSMGFLGGWERSERRAGSIVVTLTALVLYPTALGWGSFDLYRAGYAPSGLLVVLFVVAVIAWSRRFHVVVLCLVGAVAGHALELMESSNLWDYVLDPWLALAAIYDLRSLCRKS